MDAHPIYEDTMVIELRQQLPRQRGHDIATLSYATTIYFIYVIYLLDAICTSFVVLYLPPSPLATPSAFPLLLSWRLMMSIIHTPISIRFLSETRDLLL